jgi:hypothetical protein
MRQCRVACRLIESITHFTVCIVRAVLIDGEHEQEQRFVRARCQDLFGVFIQFVAGHVPDVMRRIREVAQVLWLEYFVEPEILIRVKGVIGGFIGRDQNHGVVTVLLQ